MSGSAPGGTVVFPSWFEPLHGPPAWNPAERAWSVTRYADAASVLKDPSVQVVDARLEIERLSRRSGRDYANLATLLGGHLFFRNPPFHRKARSFLKESVVLLDLMSEQAIGAVVEPLVTEAARDGRIEAMTFLCNRIPVRVMANALGLTETAVAGMFAAGQRTADATLRGVPLRTLDRLEDDAGQVIAAMLEAFATARRGGDSGLARMAALNERSYGFADRELASVAFFLILAGIETTSSALGSAIYFLSSDPHASRQVLGDPHRIRTCVDECLRMAPPLRRAVARVASDGLAAGGVGFEPGALLICEFEQASYDPETYREPGRFDPTRFESSGTGPPILSFGAGAHTCLGAALARLEVDVVIRTLFGQCRCTLVEECPDWDDHVLLRRLRALDLVVEHAQGAKAI